MKFVLLTPWISPHQLPLSAELAKILGDNEFEYHYLYPPAPHHIDWGWDRMGKESWCRMGTTQDAVLMDCDVLLTGVRDFALIDAREKAGKRSYYMTERWFKPPIGALRLLHPRYFAMARRLANLMLHSRHFTCLPIGIHAADDMAFMLRLTTGVRRIVERKPYLPLDCIGGLPSMRMWGYFVEKGQGGDGETRHAADAPLRILWAGRYLGWKRVPDLVKAFLTACLQAPMELTLVGGGPTRKYCEGLAGACPHIHFHEPMSIGQVRSLMRQHDAYVLPSNAYEGWGAVVSEALEEGMRVVATHEAGASGTMLPDADLYTAGDIAELSRRLIELAQAKRFGQFEWGTIGDWSAVRAARRFVEDAGL